jgi:predicted ATP-grasp superfamily ATP-dependent carboligase
VVIKPARSINQGELHKVAYADDRAALDSMLRDMSAQAFPVMVQRRIIGYGAAVSILRWDGKLVAAFAHRRIRENPPSGGASVVSESVAPDPVLVARSLALLERFDWNGVAMVEFKIDDATGEAWLMEVNPRFWGSLQLAVDAGVDFPRLFIGCLLGGAVSPVTSYRVGRRLRHLWGDVDRLIARLRHSRAELSLPPNAPGRLRNLVEFLAPRRGQRHEVLRLGDLRPFLVETRSWFERRRAPQRAGRIRREVGS